MSVISAMLFAINWINLQAKFEAADENTTHVWVSTFGGEYRIIRCPFPNKIANTFQRSLEIRDQHKIFEPPV